jgi:hypothetical protein
MLVTQDPDRKLGFRLMLVNWGNAGDPTVVAADRQLRSFMGLRCPRVRGAPQSIFSILIRRISARRPASMRGRPPRFRDFQRQYRRKPARCQRTSVSGWMIVTGNQRYSWMKNSPIAIRELDATAHLALQHAQLLPERGILRLKSALWPAPGLDDTRLS